MPVAGRGRGGRAIPRRAGSVARKSPAGRPLCDRPGRQATCAPALAFCRRAGGSPPRDAAPARRGPRAFRRGGEVSGPVFAALLFAAALHAGWNAIVKAGRDTALTMTSVVVAAAAMAGAALPFLAPPAAASWPWILASCLLQTVYSLLLARVYRTTDMGLAYPLMRGTAPLIVALAGVLALGEHLAPLALAGIAAISGAILLMAVDGRAAGPAGPALALANAGVIASYTLVDGVGVRLSDAPVAYTMWIFALNGVAMLAVRRGAGALRLADLARADWGRGIAGGVGTLASYGIALWAMTQAPVAMVAALRETAILFGALISVFLLGERAGRWRLAGAAGIAIGAGLLRLA